jgi:hypothetical protein
MDVRGLGCTSIITLPTRSWSLPIFHGVTISGYVRFMAMLRGTPTSSMLMLGSPVMTWSCRQRAIKEDQTKERHASKGRDADENWVRLGTNSDAPFAH